MSRFIITAPPYTDKSGGVRVLYELCNDLKNRGYDAHIFPFTGSNLSITDDDIVIYPEIVTGNPLNAKKVVRYMLNREGFTAPNKVEAGENDFILAFLPAFHDNPHAILMKQIETPIHPGMPFHERTQDATYIGKGILYNPKCNIIPGTIEITRSWPSEKQEFYNLLGRIRFFYTWDSMCGTNEDALFNGAIPIALMYRPFNKEQLFVPHGYLASDGEDVYVYVPEDFEQQREAYINVFQQRIKTYEEQLVPTIEKIEDHFRARL